MTRRPRPRRNLDAHHIEVHAMPAYATLSPAAPPPAQVEVRIGLGGWDVRSAREAVEAATARFDTGGLAALVAWSAGDDACGESPAGARRATVGPLGTIVARRARTGDIPGITSLLAASDLPPFFVEEFLPGFIVLEASGEVVGCGGIEAYGVSGIVRSVAVAEAGRGLRLGKMVGGLLIEDAIAAGLERLFLSASDAAGFWGAFGFRDLPLSEWPEETRSAWQYRFFARDDAFTASIGLHTMWRSLL